MSCITISNTIAIPPGEALNIHQIIELTCKNENALSLYGPELPSVLRLAEKNAKTDSIPNCPKIDQDYLTKLEIQMANNGSEVRKLMQKKVSNKVTYRSISLKSVK